jgi:hypothetical protein
MPEVVNGCVLLVRSAVFREILTYLFFMEILNDPFVSVIYLFGEVTLTYAS